MLQAAGAKVDAKNNSKFTGLLPEIKIHLQDFCRSNNKSTKTFITDVQFDLLCDFAHYLTKVASEKP